MIILSMGRSGSSMVSEILHNAGVWFGDCRMGDGWNPRGFFENIAIKQRIYEVYGRDWLGKPPRKKIKVDDILENEGYRDGPWAVKHGAFYAQIWENPTYVCVYRPVEKILASYARTGWLKGYDAPSLIARHMGFMDSLNGFRIDSDLIVRGETHQMQNLGEYMGLSLSFDTVDKDLWH